MPEQQTPTGGGSAGPPGQAEDLAAGSLTGRVAGSMGWSFGGKALTWACKLTKLTVVAAVLRPEDFGLFGVVLLSMAALRTFSQTGFQSALIRRQGDPDRYLDTAWSIQLLRGILLAACLALLAPVIGAFFESPEVVPLLRVMSLALFIRGFINIGVVYFRKKLQFHKDFLFNALPALLNVVSGVGLALYLRSVWALVYSSLLVNACQVALSFLLHPYKPRFRLDLEKVRELFGFGKWVLATSILGFIALHGDDAFLGKVLGMTALGVYQLAYNISTIGIRELSITINRVIFPSYSLMQSDRRRMRRACLRTLGVTVLLITPIAAGVAAVAPMFVEVLLGQKWMPAVAPMQLLCIFGYLHSPAAIAMGVFYATDRPRLMAFSILVQVGVLAVLIWPATHFLLVPGTCAAVIAGMLAGQVYSTTMLCRVLEMPGRKFIQVFAGASVPGVLMFATVRFAALALGTSLLSLILLILLGVLSYGIYCAGAWMLSSIDSPLLRWCDPFRDASDIALRALGRIE